MYVLCTEVRVLQSINSVENFEPHPAAIIHPNIIGENGYSTGMTNDANNAFISVPPIGAPTTTTLPQVIPPDCMKYIQHVLPGFTLPTSQRNPSQINPSSTSPSPQEMPSKS